MIFIQFICIQKNIKSAAIYEKGLWANPSRSSVTTVKEPLMRKIIYKLLVPFRDLL